MHRIRLRRSCAPVAPVSAALLPFALAVLVALAGNALAQDQRAFRAIPTPEAVPEGQAPVADMQIIDPAKARAAVGQVMQAWNDGELDGVLAADFQDRDRLLESMVEDVPRDAEVRVLGVRAIQTVQQFQGTTPDGRTEITSIVSLTADTQIEFNDPARGFRQLRGQNDLYLRITEEVTGE